MYIMNMSEKRFNSLKPLNLPDDILNMEADLYVVDEKVEWEYKKFVLKRLYSDNGSIFSNKLYTINELIDRKDEIGIEELIMPEKLVSVHGKIVGFIQPLIDNINFKSVLNSSEFTNKEKIGFFKEIGTILEKMANIRRYSSLKNFYLNDIHEGNFILNNKTGKINVVDMDSCKINCNDVFVSKYLFPFSPISDVFKYVCINEIDNIGGLYRVDENTEYYCYIVMILNYLYGNNITKLSMEEYYDYMEYLHSIGVSFELIDLFSLIYSEHDNINPYEHLEELSYIDGRSNYRVYEYVKKK